MFNANFNSSILINTRFQILSSSIAPYSKAAAMVTTRSATARAQEPEDDSENQDEEVRRPWKRARRRWRRARRSSETERVLVCSCCDDALTEENFTNEDLGPDCSSGDRAHPPCVCSSCITFFINQTVRTQEPVIECPHCPSVMSFEMVRKYAFEDDFAK